MAVQAIPAPAPAPVTVDGVEYTHCPCIGIPPSRACTICNSTKWTRRCEECNGSGKIFVSPRSGSNAPLRSETHGRCMGRGQLPCQAKDARIANAATAADMAKKPKAGE